VPVRHLCPNGESGPQRLAGAPTGEQRARSKGRFRVKLTVERLPSSRVQLEISAEEDEAADALRRAVRKVGQQIVVPGFRKGKAPQAMIERLYGPEVFAEEANQILMTDLYRRALEQVDLVPVGDPEVDISSLEPLTFTVTVPVYPEIDPGNYRDVRVEPIDAAVDEASVEELLEALRRSHSPWIDPPSEGLEVGPNLELTPKSRFPAAGDQVTIDYTVQVEGEPAEEPVVDAEFILGESGLLAPVEEAITSLRAGGSATFAVPFAEDDQTVDEELRGKTLEYSVTLKGLKVRDLLPLDDDFAKTVGDVDSLDELRRDLRDNMHRSRTAEARAEVVSQIVERLNAQAEVDLPEPMIDRAVEEDLTRLRARFASQGIPLGGYLRATAQSEDDLRAELRDAATQRLRTSLLLRAVAEKEGITVDSDVDDAVAMLAQMAEGSEDPKRAAAFARSEEVRDRLESDMYERRLTERLIELATEGRGPVLNAWTPPAPAETTTSDATGEPATGEESAQEAEADSTIPLAEGEEEPVAAR
jgi:trigger factor